MSEDKRNKQVKRRNLNLQSLDGNFQFDMFIRQNTMFVEQFYIGLRFKTDDKKLGTITLIRYNGEHGQNDWSKDNHYKAFHIHKISERLLKAGIIEPKEIEITQKFETFEGAVNEFIRDVQVKNYADYFPHSDKQMLLFEGNKK